jgi:LysM repeat protein
MRVRTWSACVALAWGILLIMTAVGSSGPFRPAQANTRIASTISNASSTNSSSSTTIQATLTSYVTHRPAGTMTGTTDTGTYLVQPGDSLSGIASALGISGGWPALYTANRQVIGSDPGLICPGTLLVLPGGGSPIRYTVGVGDTLSGIAAAFGISGGWPALYAANRQEIGPNPDAIRAGTVLAIPHSASRASHPTSSTSPPVSRPKATSTGTPASVPPTAPAVGAPCAAAQPPAHAPVQASAVSSNPTTGRRHPRSAPMLTVGGLPRWLEIVLLAAGLLIATAFLTEPVLAIARRRRALRPAAADANIVLADYERLVVTHNRQDGTVYVLRPPDADPQAILLAARLVLGQDRYEALAGHLGVPAHWPRE